MIKALMKHPEGFQQWTRGIGMIAMRGEAGWVIIDHPSNHYPANLELYRDEPPVKEPTSKPTPKKRGRPKGSKNTKAKK